ncbi:MAG: MBL fold metallo-hydrolase [Candidatus Eisenbacteria bacterium]
MTRSRAARLLLLLSTLLLTPAAVRGAAGDATIYEIQQGVYAQYTFVTVDSVVVTGALTETFFAEEAAAGPYSGIQVNRGAAHGAVRGDLVTVSGYYVEFDGVSLINATSGVGGSVTILGGGFPVPTADEVAVGDVNTGSGTGESWEGVLVTLDSVLCVSVGASDWTVVEFDGDSPGETLVVDDLFSYNIPAAGDSIRILTGVMHGVSGERVLLPRDNYDVLAFDLVPPGTITDLAASPGEYNGTVDLTWTATGDDAGSGTASAYVVRYGVSPINEGNWASATDVDGEPAPQSAGSAESWTCQGLPAGQTLYFAMRAEDEQYQQGGVSNSVSSFVTDAQPKLEIHCINVGQGDCTLVRSGAGKTFLFDAGWNGEGYAEVIPYLTSLGITQLTYVGVSHYDADHLGGMDEVINSVGVDSASYDRGWSYNTTSYFNYVSAAGGLRTTINDGDVIDLGDGVDIRCVAVNGNGLLAPPFDSQYDENDLCVGYVVKVGNFQFFVGGDISGNAGCVPYHDIETSVGNEVGDIEVLRTNHHGSHCNTNANFVNALSPEAAIISVGDGNPYGHPTSTVIGRLVNYGAYIYQTELGTGGSIPPGRGEVAGDVVIRTNGLGTYTIQDSIYAVDAVTGVPSAAVPGLVALLPNMPNPFNPTTTVRFRLPEAGPARLVVLDVRGRVVDVIAAGEQPAGERSFTWGGTDRSGRDVASGVYFIRLEAGNAAATRKMTLIR